MRPTLSDHPVTAQGHSPIRMDSTDPRPLRNALIPWVIALLVLFGWNALAQDHARLRKLDSSDEVGLSALVDAPPTPGRTFNPLLFIAPNPAARITLLDRTTRFLCVEIRRELPVVSPLHDSVQGRAPPAVAHS